MKPFYRRYFRFQPLYHLLVFPLALLFFGVCVYMLAAYSYEGAGIEVLYFALLSVLILLIGLQSRRLPFQNQRRIMMLEMRLRYLELSGKSFRPLEKQLNIQQIAALRLAADDELLPLLDAALNEKLSAKQIHQRIKKGRSDKFLI
ncbi:MAG: DUF6526 family protein [Bacteroidia bacterium]|jgi:hypothetical protein